MRLLAVIFFICAFQSVIGQHGDNYLKLMNDLILVDSLETKKCFKNGNLKELGLIKYYRHGDFVYEMEVGKHFRYYKDGSRSEYFFDDWGTELYTAHYDSDDNLIMEWITTKLETTAKDLNTFFKSNKHITYNASFKDYRYNYDECKYYLRKEGQYSNGKKDGLWKFYLVSGELQKTKQY